MSWLYIYTYIIWLPAVLNLFLTIYGNQENNDINVLAEGAASSMIHQCACHKVEFMYAQRDI